MINVVITEDEMLVRLGLKMCIDNSGDLRVVAAFASGEETEAFFQRDTADVLITDVRLTGMDGLELIRRVRPLHPNMAVIVLSCYEDFAYARTALNVGADGYYLKHEINEEEIPRLVRELAAKKKKRHDDYSRQDGLPHRAEELFAGEEMTAVYFLFRGEGEPRCTGGEDLNLGMLAGIIQTIMDGSQLGRCFLFRGGEMVGLIRRDGSLSEGEGGARLRRFYSEVSSTLENCTGKNCYMGVSDAFSSSELLSVRIGQARSAAEYSFYSETGGIFYFSPSAEIQCPSLPFVRENAFTKPWQKHQQESLRHFFAMCSETRPATERVKEAVVRFLHSMSAYAEQYFRMDKGTAFPPEYEPNYGNVSRFDSVICLEKWLTEVVRLVTDFVSAQLDAGNLIRQYLENHYREELSQTELAAVFHMSSAYFCQYFKKTLGESFVPYLNKLRINKAKELLRTTAMSTEEIAEAVGIPNANYFFRLFKKQEGCTTKEFRRRSGWAGEDSELENNE